MHVVGYTRLAYAHPAPVNTWGNQDFDLLLESGPTHKPTYARGVWVFNHPSRCGYPLPSVLYISHRPIIVLDLQMSFVTNHHHDNYHISCLVDTTTIKFYQSALERSS